MKNSEVLKIVVDGLISRNIINNKKDIVVSDVKKVDESYVVYDKNYEKNINAIRNWFYKKNIILLGRFSYFEYINVDMAVNRSIEIFKKLNHIKTKKSVLLKRILEKKFS